MMERVIRSGRALLVLGLLGVSALLWPTSSDAAELVMFRQAGCEWCDKWDEDIGVVYGKTPEAGIAPLRVLDIHDERPADLVSLKPVIYTPTFVLAEDGREIGRILGYPGEDFFWSFLDRLLARVTPATCKKGDTACLH